MTINAVPLNAIARAGTLYPASTPGPGPAWTAYAPSADSRLIYVDDTLGSSNGDVYSLDGSAPDGVLPGGTWEFPTDIAPFQTPAQGEAQLRDGFPDYLLFKRGETWTNQQIGSIGGLNGRSASEPMIFGAYGAGERPVFEVSRGSSGVSWSSGDNVSHLYFMSLDFYGYTYDPGNPSFVSPTSGVNQAMISMLSETDDVLIEDCVLRYNWGNGVGASGLVDTNFTIRYSTIHHCYGRYTGGQTNRASGIYFAPNATGWLMEGVVFHHNGWLEYVNGSYLADAGPSQFSHNAYVDAGALGDIIGCFSSYASFQGLMHRGSGNHTDNISFHDPRGMQLSHNSIAGSGNLLRNTALNGRNKYNEDYPAEQESGSATAFIIRNAAGINYGDNIAANIDPGETGTAFSIAGTTTNLGGDIVHEWPNSNDTGFPSDYVDPERDLASYSAAIGGAGTEADFFANLLTNHRQNWDSNYQVSNIKDYIDEGFGLV